MVTRYTRFFTLAIIAAFGSIILGEPLMAQEHDLENTLYMELKDGRVVIEMRPDLAPNHVERIKELVRDGFYNGTAFHRVIDGFMAQTGDPTGKGSGGSGQKIRAEFSDEHHVRGTVSMARTSDPHSADSQFFICFDDALHLDGQYTIWGQVVEGMEYVDKIKRGAPGSGQVADPDMLVTLQVAAEVEEGASAEVEYMPEAAPEDDTDTHAAND